MKKIKNESQFDEGKRKNENELRIFRTETSRSNQPKLQQNVSRNRMASVKAEMHIRSRESSVEGKTSTRNGRRKNEGSAKNS